MNLRKLTFKGGVHPPEFKELTEKKSIEVLPLPEAVVIPVQQHIGAPAEPVVEVGDEVKVGDVVCEAKGFVSVPSHASVSGKVTKIEKRLHPVGGKVLSIVIESDGEDQKSSSIAPVDNYFNLSIEEMKKNGAEVIHLATGLIVGYPPCPYITYFHDFIETKFGLEVIYGTHPIPEKYLKTHRKLGTWQEPQWEEILQPTLANEETRLAYD